MNILDFPVLCAQDFFFSLFAVAAAWTVAGNKYNILIVCYQVWTLSYYKHPVTGIYLSLPLCPHWVQTLPVAVAIYSQGNKDYLSERWITRGEVSPLALGWQRGRCVWDLVKRLAEIGQIYDRKSNPILRSAGMYCLSSWTTVSLCGDEAEWLCCRCKH